MLGWLYRRSFITLACMMFLVPYALIVIAFNFSNMIEFVQVNSYALIEVSGHHIRTGIDIAKEKIEKRREFFVDRELWDFDPDYKHIREEEQPAGEFEKLDDSEIYCLVYSPCFI